MSSSVTSPSRKIALGDFSFLMAVWVTIGTYLAKNSLILEIKS